MNLSVKKIVFYIEKCYNANQQIFFMYFHNFNNHPNDNAAWEWGSDSQVPCMPFYVSEV
jgi:hypothetical protein